MFWGKLKNLIFDEDEQDLEIKIVETLFSFSNYLNYSYNKYGYLSYDSFSLIDNMIEFILEEFKNDMLSKNCNLGFDILKV